MSQAEAIRRVRPDDPRPDPHSRSTRQPVRAARTVTAAAGVALVSVTLDNDTAADLRVRVENDLDGPALPPRREGVPAAGWDGDRFTGVVPADGRLGVGYACPIGAADVASARAADQPASVEILGPVDDATGDASASDPVAAAVRSLGRATPPIDAIPAETAAEPEPPVSRTEPHRRREPTPPTAPETSNPVAAWLDAVERRVQLAEQLTDAAADEAAAAIEDSGGIDDVATLPAELGGDAGALRSIGGRIDDLAARAAAADPEPVVSSLVAAADGEEPTERDAKPESDAPPPHGPTAGRGVDRGSPR